MNRSALLFNRPDELAATRPAESKGLSRDGGRLLVTSGGRNEHARFIDLAEYLRSGDLLVVNRSSTLAASLPVNGKSGSFTLNLSTNYGSGLWLAEPRLSPAMPGPLSEISAGERIQAAGIEARFIAPYPGIPRLWFVQFEADACLAMRRAGQPIRYSYIDGAYGLQHYQTLFAAIPGSAEMPSAAYPFTRRVLDRIIERGVKLSGILLHTGVSSLEVEDDEADTQSLYPEPFKVPAATARAVNAAKAEGRRVIAVGTTVVRALESAWDGQQVRTSSGFTRLFIHPGRGVSVVDGLLTGLHDPVTTHLMMLYAIGGQETIRKAYSEAVRKSYRWHEFGDSHLIVSGESEEAGSSLGAMSFRVH